MQTWPAGLPFFVSRDAYRRSGAADGFIESSVSVGKPKRRRRTSVVQKPFRGRINNITSAELAIFEAFFETDLVNGMLEFEATDPVTQSLRNYRFVAGRPPVIVPKGLRFSVEADLEIWG